MTPGGGCTKVSGCGDYYVMGVGSSDVIGSWVWL